MVESSIEIHGEPPSPHEVNRIIMDEAEQAMGQAMSVVLGEVMHRTPVRTGHLRRSMNKSVHRVGPSKVAGSVGSDVFYGPFLERGTGLYGPRNAWIVPKTAQALRFPQPGNPGFTLGGRVRSGAAGAGAQFVFATRVRGIRPRRFMRDSAMVTEPAVHAIFRQHAFQAARRVESAVRR